MNLLHVGIATAGLAYLTSSKSPVPQVNQFATKIPGVKTFGIPATVGLASLAVDRFIRPNRWLKILGVAGVVLAAAKVGEAGTDFKFVGDDDVADIGDDDIADLDDDVGDYDDE